MLRRNIYSSCQRLYWEPTDLEAEAQLASFQYRGQLYHLEFDGIVDEIVLKGLRNFQSIATDISEFALALPMLRQVSNDLKVDRRIPFVCGSGKNWVASRQGGGGGKILFRSSIGQTAALSTDSKGQSEFLTLRTQGAGIIHEIKARCGGQEKLTTIAEAVTVF